MTLKLTVEPTEIVELFNGTECRIWRGQSEGGVPVLVWIAVVHPQTHDKGELQAFKDHLRSFRSGGAVGTESDTP